ncbi:MAG TPA: oligosaccharide flippase family protein [Hanamia sp.]|nr:oligosaccharide flippase family protein [Hanamia sp.]
MSRKFIHDISSNSLQVIINQVCGFAIFYVLSVYFSKNDFGEINWSLAILLTVFSILSLGIDQLIVKKIAAHEDPKLMFSVYRFHVILAGSLFYAFLLIAYFMNPSLFQKHYLLLFLGIGKLMIFFASPFKQLANGLEKFKALFFMSVCSSLVRGTALIILAFFSQLNLAAVIVIFIVGDFAELILSAFISKKYLKIPFSISWSKSIYFNLLKESLPQAGVVIFTSAIARFDWIFLGILASDIALADYSFAFKVFEVATLPLLVIAPVLIPRFTKIFHAKESTGSEKIKDLFVLLKLEIIIASFVALLLNILWIPVIDYITHGKYGAVNRYTILILSASMPFIYINNFLWTINFSKGRLKIIFYIFFITFLVNVLGNVFLIPSFSAEGAALAYLAAITVQFILFIVKTPVAGFKKNILPFLLAPVVAIAAGSLSIHTFDNLALILFLSIFIFFFLLLFTKVLRKSDWLVFKKITGI